MTASPDATDAETDLDGLTFGDLYRFADLARGAGLDEDELVGVETTDEVGNELGTHTLVADLGDADGLVRPGPAPATARSATR